MMRRVSCLVCLVCLLVVVAVPSAQAIPIPSKQCAYKCGSGVSCSTPCWAQFLGGGPWRSITCGEYYFDGEWEGGGTVPCQSLVGPVMESGLDRFLRSLESLAEDDAATAFPKHGQQ